MPISRIAAMLASMTRYSSWMYIAFRPWNAASRGREVAVVAGEQRVVDDGAVEARQVERRRDVAEHRQAMIAMARVGFQRSDVVAHGGGNFRLVVAEQQQIERSHRRVGKLFHGAAIEIETA